MSKFELAPTLRRVALKVGTALRRPGVMLMLALCTSLALFSAWYFASPPAPGDVASRDAASRGTAACIAVPDSRIVKAGGAGSVTTKCGIKCLSKRNEEDRVACIASCIAERTGLSNQCAACFGQNFVCSFSCATSCVKDIWSDKCKRCRCARGCPNAFETCAGIHDPSCDQLSVDAPPNA